MRRTAWEARSRRTCGKKYRNWPAFSSPPSPSTRPEHSRGIARRITDRGAVFRAMDPTDRIEEEIALFALGAIDGPERHVIEAHLKKCARCRARLEEAQAAAGLLPAALDPILPSGHSREKLLSRVRSDPRTGRAKLLRPLRALFSLHFARIGLIFV